MKLPAETAPTPESSRDQRRKVPFVAVLVFLGILLPGSILFLTLNVSPNQKLVWLTPAEFRQTTQPALFARIKYTIINLTGPFLRGFIRVRPQIDIASSLMTLTTAAGETTGLGPPAATNSAGARSWVLAPDDFQSFQRRLKTISGAAVLSRPRISTASGGQSQLSMGEATIPEGKSSRSSLTIAIIPKVANGSIKLLVCATSTEVPASPGANLPLIQTNLAVSCQALLSNGGGLVLEAGPTKAGAGTNYWLIISPTAIDARGNPIKL